MGQPLLVRPGQAVEVVQDASPLLAILEVELAAAAEFAQEEEDSIPEEGAAVVDDPLLATRVGDIIEPVIEGGEEVADGAGQDGPDLQGRPALRLLWRV